KVARLSRSSVVSAARKGIVIVSSAVAAPCAQPVRVVGMPRSSVERTVSVREVEQSRPMSDVTTRALRLLARLQSRAVWSGSQPAGDMSMTSRTVSGVVDRLELMGCSVLPTAEHGGGYNLGAGQALPSLLRRTSEGIVVVVGLLEAVSTGVE